MKELASSPGLPMLFNVTHKKSRGDKAMKKPHLYMRPHAVATLTLVEPCIPTASKVTEENSCDLTSSLIAGVNSILAASMVARSSTD